MSTDTNTSPPPPSFDFHLALAVSNIKNFVPLILNFEKVQYSNWVELFRTHAHAYQVLDHIDSKVPRPDNISTDLWKRLDFVVKQWIYGTISVDILKNILSVDASAMDMWTRIQRLFQDNKNTRALYLETKFNTIHLSQFSSITAYYQELKSISDQLANIDHPVSENKLVLRLVGSLAKTDYALVAVMIRQSDPLPSFDIARSHILLEETCNA